MLASTDDRKRRIIDWLQTRNRLRRVAWLPYVAFLGPPFGPLQARLGALAAELLATDPVAESLSVKVYDIPPFARLDVAPFDTEIANINRDIITIGCREIEGNARNAAEIMLHKGVISGMVEYAKRWRDLRSIKKEANEIYNRAASANLSNSDSATPLFEMMSALLSRLERYDIQTRPLDNTGRMFFNYVGRLSLAGAVLVLLVAGVANLLR